MPFDLDTLKKYSKECNITFKGVLHVGSHNDAINKTYNSLNIHNNNIVWVESDTVKAEYNKANNLPNVFTTVIDELNSAIKYINKNNLDMQPCNQSCCVEIPKLIITEINSFKIQPLNEFMEFNNFDPCEYNIWNFDCMGSEFRIFKGSKELLKFADIIYTGVNSTEINKKNNRMSEIDKLLSEHGLKRIETIKNEDNWCMAIYVRI